VLFNSISILICLSEVRTPLATIGPIHSFSPLSDIEKAFVNAVEKADRRFSSSTFLFAVAEAMLGEDGFFNKSATFSRSVVSSVVRGVEFKSLVRMLCMEETFVKITMWLLSTLLKK